MSTKHILLPSFILILLLSLSTEAAAQTCRISSGIAGDGCRTYMEVYEYDYVSIKPSFPGGDDKLIQYINNERQYPREAYQKRIEGRVTCSFVVCADGKVDYIKVLKGVEPSLNAEAIRIIQNMPQWSPGKMEGKAVPVRVIRSIPFRR